MHTKTDGLKTYEQGWYCPSPKKKGACILLIIDQYV